jgi:hypothetical protein
MMKSKAKTITLVGGNIFQDDDKTAKWEAPIRKFIWFQEEDVVIINAYGRRNTSSKQFAQFIDVGCKLILDVGDPDEGGNKYFPFPIDVAVSFLSLRHVFQLGEKKEFIIDSFPKTRMTRVKKSVQFLNIDSFPKKRMRRERKSLH